mgnify:CR=1 FL=1
MKKKFETFMDKFNTYFVYDTFMCLKIKWIEMVTNIVILKKVYFYLNSIFDFENVKRKQKLLNVFKNV